MESNLIVVQGLPGTGKTTLSRRLGEDLGFTYLGKDMLKEFMFDTLGVADRAESRVIGRVAARALFIFADEYLAAGKSVIIESAFHPELARKDIEQLIKKHQPRYVELLCKTQPGVWQERVVQRVITGARHPGHFDTATPPTTTEADYASIGIPPTIEIDTTHFGDKEYNSLLKELNTLMLKSV